MDDHFGDDYGPLESCYEEEENDNFTGDYIGGFYGNAKGVTPEEKQGRIKACGARHFYCNPEDSELKFVSYYCGYFRECPTCLTIRAKKQMKIMTHAFEEWGQENLHCERITIDGWRSYRDKLGKAGYLFRAFPTEDGVIIIHNDAHGTSFTMPDWNTWKEWCKSPPQRRLSGRLGRLDPPSPPEDMESIAVDVYGSDASEKARAEVAKELCGQPTVVDHDGNCVRSGGPVDLEAFLQALKDRGFRVWVTGWRKIYVSKTYTENLHKRNKTPALT